ncbi:uncharacterized protein LOC122044292 [Zingiber officinale]|uniref:uncharacterized protein LOC122044292 n=1 Tax=Zingiber officinale TaxID=94328 RepID=UPI001C4B90C7|nr:uncharacterized protein LOC122044292 [Zingiber officinale]
MEGLTFPNDWRTAITEFLKSGATPPDRLEAHLLRRRAGRFVLIGDQFYKKAFFRPLLKCVGPEDVDYILQEVHQGSCGGHLGGRSLARKILLAGYFWPTLQEDTVATCLSCQKYHNFSHRPAEELKTSTVSCSFDQWGMDIVGPFPMRLISDNGRQFLGQQLKEWCEEYDIQQAFTSVAYPQSNGRVIPRSFQVGDLVWKKVKSVGDVTKLGAPWVGPFKIVEKLRSGAYYLEDEDRWKLERPWNASHLQPYRAG